MYNMYFMYFRYFSFFPGSSALSPQSRMIVIAPISWSPNCTHADPASSRVHIVIHASQHFLPYRGHRIIKASYRKIYGPNPKPQTLDPNLAKIDPIWPQGTPSGSQNIHMGCGNIFPMGFAVAC